MSDHLYTLQPVGIIRSCYQEKFGIPRQPGLATSARAKLELSGACNCPEAVAGLDAFSHIWVQFLFHETQGAGWRPTVRPPRLGGEKRMGVFATRATHRPNPLGLSLVKLEKICQKNGQVWLELSGIDLLDNTPVVDIKPYLPWADAIDNARAGFAPEAPDNTPVCFTEQAREECKRFELSSGHPLESLIQEVLTQDPRPAYLKKRPRKEYGVLLWDYNIRWRIIEINEAGDTGFEVFSIEAV
ncbi:tRNA (N6-threonylcarbamoyladenosine(37)-N6)-methyltransferase TrmO [Sansalvadorimonas verongulae]|uniref:tRNA (N6-threonylcarbamoyladenosine(37)-N6)-methyltransferase TrmO n=1 Tax=Sansalvadorimonas verongulae TaxID=2172824 RepID=UPI002E337433|nr:tRNA (N6-threonylcarbamoyladenosine(37)-N6)-methyltransferase TrmO [Sansalvadorimonas verongulae]MTI13777.1 tRNA (N6-threonylcarbamoyladenosine(37)-N6)-methyltransferase TrmO [Sansalvadorimonas verongulae]